MPSTKPRFIPLLLLTFALFDGWRWWGLQSQIAVLQEYGGQGQGVAQLATALWFGLFVGLAWGCWRNRPIAWRATPFFVAIYALYHLLWEQSGWPLFVWHVILFSLICWHAYRGKM